MNARRGNASAVFVGLAVLDVVQHVIEPPSWGTKGLATGVELAAGGPATNAAITCAAAGVPSTLITALGASPQAQLVGTQCRELGVQVIDLVPGQVPEPGGSSQGDWQLPVASCIVDARGERTVVSTGALDSAFVASAQALAALARANVLLVDGHHPQVAQQALQARPTGCRAVLDAGSAKAVALPWLNRLDVVAGSADYAAGLGRLCGASAGADPMGHALAGGAQAAVMTAGAGPVHWMQSDGQAGVCHPVPVCALDTLGAGDAWHGAFAAALAAGWDVPGAVDYATGAASIRVQYVGARTWLQHLPAVPQLRTP